MVVGREDDGSDLAGQVSQVGGFSDGTLEFDGFSSATSSSSSIGDSGEIEDTEKLIDRSINATIVLAARTFAITKLLTIDQDYWQGWTIFLNTKICTSTQLECLRGSSEAKPSFSQNDDQWSSLFAESTGTGSINLKPLPR
ncbi:hypothetical protein EZV62_007228 [Acer yangbiense]|uniref:Uncharacterized protein n=1 Tax=Acer yangbiense TaxID=1000413 RepID=A0A5C7I8P1_9ROSI|nr:hypothetical protein EZV62_007228 [Acer yangbiense]